MKSYPRSAKKCIFRGVLEKPTVACVLAAVLAAIAMACNQSSDEVESGPADNALVFVIDTLRADRLSVMGAVRPTSPVIDALAENGAVFRRAMANSPWTVPATASMVTSLLPAEHGAALFGETRNLDDQVPGQIRDGIQTLSTILAEASFKTGLFSANPFLYGRFKDGFDVAEVNVQNASELTDKVLDFIEANRGERFYAHIQYIDLHHPVDPPPPYFNFFATPGHGERNETHKNWSFGKGEYLDTDAFKDYRANKLALYDGAIRFVDTQIGRILRHLEMTGLDTNTAVFITSDHGEEFWDHASVGLSLGGDPRGSYGTGHGHSMFQEVLHVPLVVVGPLVSPGLDLDLDVTLLDLAPTALGILGITAPDVMRGRDLRPALTGQHGVAIPETVLFADSPAYGPNAWCMISGRWKIISRSDGKSLLYDLVTDPGESNDLSSRESELAASLTGQLQKFRDSVRDNGPSERATPTDETLNQLKALGYLE
jgi:arylsulfatase A-like enzyme